MPTTKTVCRVNRWICVHLLYDPIKSIKILTMVGKEFICFVVLVMIIHYNDALTFFGMNKIALKMPRRAYRKNTDIINNETDYKLNIFLFLLNYLTSGKT